MSSSNSGFILYAPSQAPCWDPVLYWSPASQPAESHGMGDCVEKGRKGTSFGWRGGSKVRRREPVKIRKWEQGMKFRREASAGGRKGFLWAGQLRLKRVEHPQELFAEFVSSGFSVSLKTLPLKKPFRALLLHGQAIRCSGERLCYPFPADLASLRRWLLWVQRCARGCKEGAFPLQEDGSSALWPALPSLPWYFRGRQGSWRGFLLASQSIISQCLLFIPLAKPSPHPCHSGRWEFL